MSENSGPTPPTVSDFRSAYNAFADGVSYPDGTIQIWLNTASGSVNNPAALDPNRWGQFWVIGCMLFAAHFIALNKREDRAAEFEGVTGTATPGVVASKAIGGASVSYDVGSSIEDGGGHWNLTIYGRQYLRFARMAGMGGVQVSGGSYVGPYNGPAWPGVIYPR